MFNFVFIFRSRHDVEHDDNRYDTFFHDRFQFSLSNVLAGEDDVAAAADMLIDVCSNFNVDDRIDVELSQSIFTFCLDEGACSHACTADSGYNYRRRVAHLRNADTLFL